MPARQRGYLEKLPSGRWSARYYDENGKQRRAGQAWRTKTEAADWLRAKVDETERLRRGEAPAPEQIDLTVEEAVDRYLAQHDVDPATISKLTRELKHAKTRFGDRPLRSLRPDELSAWRLSLSQGSRHGVFRALKQVLEQAARWEWIEKNPATYVKNPKPKPPEIQPFASWDEIEKIAAELSPRYAAIPLFAVGTGLRIEEWLALERRDVDRKNAVVTVERVYTQGVLKQCAKTSRQRRRVPLRQRVLDALEAVPPRLDSPLLFPAARGGHIELNKWREREWKPALVAAGLEHRRPYDMRHTYASWSLAAGVSLFTLSRRMGTSLAMIDQTYGHLAPDAEEQERVLLDAFDEAATERQRGRR
jgi:integrase